jgi:hypothetical protein
MVITIYHPYLSHLITIININRKQHEISKTYRTFLNYRGMISLISYQLYDQIFWSHIHHHITMLTGKNHHVYHHLSLQFLNVYYHLEIQNP